MNEAHLHLLLNHSPILGSFLGLGLLLAGVLRPNDSLTRAGLLTLVAAAGLAMATSATGEGAEEIVMSMPGASAATKALIHAHERAADLSLWALTATGALAILSLLLLARGHARARLTTLLTLAGAVLSFGLMSRAGSLGGQIMHPETRPGFEAEALAPRGR